MAEMAAAAPAMNLVPDHAESVVSVFQHRAFDGFIEARPAGAAVELGLGREQRQIASGANERARAMLIVEGAGEGTLGLLLAQHRILLGSQKLAPFLRRVGHLEGAGNR